MTWSAPVVPATSWTTVTNSAATWQASGAGTQSWATARNSAQTWQGSGSPSSESRLNPVYPLSVNPGGDLDYAWHIQSDGNFVVATGNNVQIKSRITDGP